LSQIVRLGRKYALYLPKNVVKTLGLKEGDNLLLEVRGNTLILKPVPRLFKKRKYWSETSVNEFEAESEEIIKVSEAEEN